MKRQNYSSSCPQTKPQQPELPCPQSCSSCNTDLYSWLLWQLGLKRCPGQKRRSGWQKRAGCGKNCAR